MGQSDDTSDAAGTSGGALGTTEIQAFFETLGALRAKLEAIDPDPDKKWHAGAVRPVIDQARHQVLSKVDSVVDALRADHADTVAAVHASALALVGDAAGLAVAAGELETGKRLLKDAKQSASSLHPSPLPAELAAAFDAPRAWALLTHGRWLLSKGKTWRGERQLKRAKKLVSGGALRQCIVDALTGPRPVGKMPTLTTINGIGTQLYGARDRWPDGSAVATLFFCLMFIPVLPLAAYRVLRDGDGYRVYARYPLGPIARAWLGALALGLVLLVGGTATLRHLSSAPARFARDMAALEETLAIGDREASARALEALLTTHPNGPGDDIARYAGKLVELQLGDAAVPRPLDETSAPKALEALNIVKLLPAPVRQSVASDVGTRVKAWLTDLEQRGDDNQAAFDARVALARRATAATGDGAFDDIKRDLELKAAIAGAGRWPAATVARLATIEGEAARKATLEILSRAPSAGALAAVEVIARALLAAPAAGKDATTLDPGLRASLEMKLTTLETRRSSQARAAALADIAESEDASHGALDVGPAASSARAAATRAAAARARVTWLSKNPDDQEVAALAAGDALAASRIETARQIVNGAGPKGWHGFELLVAGAEVALEQGELQGADELFDQALAERLPQFASVASELAAASSALQQSFYDKANADLLPPDVMARLRSGNPEEQGRIFHELYQEASAKNPKLTALTTRFQELAPVVETALRSGTLKLWRAAASSDDAEERRLLMAAEQTFLSIQSTAADDPTYQLGLGEVKYRIRQPEEGQKLLEEAAARGDPMLSLSVAAIYRGVGEVERARVTARRVFDEAAATSPPKANAAGFLAVLSDDPDEQLEYLEHCDGDDDFIRAQLAGARGAKLLREGKEREADAELAKAASINEKAAATSDSAANNAAVAYLARYSLTGDLRHIKKARALLDKALRLSPSSQIVIGNLIGLTKHEIALGLLDHALDLATLRPADDDAGFLAYAQRDNAEANRAFSSAALERLAEQQRVLAPTNPGGWAELVGIYVLRKDAQALARLESGLAGVRLDTSSGAQAFAAWTIEEAIAEADRRLARLATLRPKDAATKGAVAALESVSLVQRGALKADEKDILDGIARAVGAEKLWPALDLRSQRRDALVKLGFVRALRAGDAAADAMAKGDFRAYVMVGAQLPLALAAGRFPEAKGPLSARAEWQEAAVLSREIAASVGAPTASQYSLDLAVGDTAAAEATRSALAAAPWITSHFRLEGMLEPYDLGANDAAAVVGTLR